MVICVILVCGMVWCSVVCSLFSREMLTITVCRQAGEGRREVQRREERGLPGHRGQDIRVGLTGHLEIRVIRVIILS